MNLKNLLTTKNIVLVCFILILAVCVAANELAHKDYTPEIKSQIKYEPATNDLVAAVGPNPASEVPPPAPSPTPKNNTTTTKPAPAQDKNTPAPTKPENCGSDFDCYQTYYQSIVKASGVTAAFDELKLEYPKNGYVQSQCHPITHTIGQAAILLYPNVSEAYVNGDGFCWSGYYHGVMEGIVGKVGRSNFLGGLNTYCADIPTKASYSFDYFNCVHGLGHGVMVYSTGELFDSLKLCDQLNGSWEQSSCQGGVFMENVIIDNKNHFTKFLKEEDLLYPCNAVDVKYKGQCYLMQTSYILKENGGNFQNAFELCGQADAGYEATCWQSLGRDVSSRHYSYVPGVKTSCALGVNFEQESNCLVGAVKDVISYFHSDTQAKELCTLYEGDLKTLCESTAKNYYQNF